MKNHRSIFLVTRFMKFHFAVLALLLFLGCEPEYNPRFVPSPSMATGRPTISVIGYGWAPNSQVEIWAYSEPMLEGTDVVAKPPRLMGTIQTDGNGHLGNNYANWWDMSDLSRWKHFPITPICAQPSPYVLTTFIASDKKNKLFVPDNRPTGAYNSAYYRCP